MKKTLLNKILYIFATFILSLFYVVGVGAMSVSAEGMTVGYSDVLTDLKKDKSFKVSDFPEYTYEEIKTSDKELLDVISLAEGSEQELFLYVYNPTRKYLDITATEVSMYCEYAANPTEFHPQAYELKLVSQYSVFDKYVVEGFSVSDKADRYYNIIEISRPFDENIDTSIEGGTTDNKAIPIAKQWYCHYYNDELIYEMGEFDVLEITPTLTEFFRCKNGITFNFISGTNKAQDVHFIAFNCENYKVEHIYDADLKYRYREIEEFVVIGDETDEDPSEGNWSDKIPITITDKEEATYEGKGLNSKTLKWNRISKAKDFVKSYEDQGGTLSDTVKETLSQSQWVFCFTETEYSTTVLSNGTYYRYKQVGNVDILRIHFMDVGGKYYNLGVVSDKVTGNLEPGGSAGGVDMDDWWDGFWDHDWEGLWDIIVDGFLGVISAIFAIVLVVVLVKLIIGGIKLLLGRK